MGVSLETRSRILETLSSIEVMRLIKKYIFKNSTKTMI